MYFDEGRNLKHAQYKKSEAHHVINSAGQTEREGCGRSREAAFAPLKQISEADRGRWQAADVLDVTNNKLQELMQLLYLLGRDPAVPQDARYHVTVAQSEIALLSRLMQNTANPQGENAKPSAAAAGL